MSGDLNIKSEINQLIEEYASIRRKFEICKKKHSRYLEGNDNYIGIIGEYWATIFLEQKYEDAIKPFLDRKEKKHNGKEKKHNGKEKKHNVSEKWFDFSLVHTKDEKKCERISVKAISSENKQGKSGPIKYISPKDIRADILSVIIVKLDADLMPEQLLYIKDLYSSLNLKNCNGKYYNYSNHWQVGKSSLAFKYYKDDGFDQIFSSKIWVWDNDKFVRKTTLLTHK